MRFGSEKYGQALMTTGASAAWAGRNVYGRDTGSVSWGKEVEREVAWLSQGPFYVKF